MEELRAGSRPFQLGFALSKRSGARQTRNWCDDVRAAFAVAAVRRNSGNGLFLFRLICLPCSASVYVFLQAMKRALAYVKAEMSHIK